MPKWLFVVGAIFVVCCLGGVILFATNQNKTDDARTAPSAGPGGRPGRAEAGIGQPVRDGKFEFTVQGVQCGQSEVGEPPLSDTAQGQFCLASLTVKNIGDRSQSFDDDSQKAIAPNGTEYSASSSADLDVNQNNPLLLQPINPGNQINAVIAYDIPKTAQIDRLQLHDSAMSMGATVKVG